MEVEVNVDPRGADRRPGFRQSAWDDMLARHVSRRAVEWLEEDLGAECDWTSVGLIDATQSGSANVVCRRDGVVAGLEAGRIVAAAVDAGLAWEPMAQDGDRVAAGATVARLTGPIRSLLSAERTLLNVMGRMSGVATATKRLVDAVAGTACRIYDTRKTMPGWRWLDKYAVRVGGGWNHRHGLFDAILIKDNHLAALAREGVGPAAAVLRARAFLAATFPAERAGRMVVEIEVDSLGQLEDVLSAAPDVVLLDNMKPETLDQAVAMRNAVARGVVLEASGGVSPESVSTIARTGVDRISAGWPTHHAPWLDVALDWAGGM